MPASASPEASASYRNGASPSTGEGTVPPALPAPVRDASGRQQRPAFPEKQDGFAEQSELANRRDVHGNHVVQLYAYSEGLPDPEAEDDPLFDDLIRKVEQYRPIAGAFFRWVYHALVRPAVRDAARVHAEEWEKIACHNARAVAQNPRIEAEIEQVQSDLDLRVAPFEERIEELSERIREARNVESRLAAAAGCFVGEEATATEAASQVLRLHPPSFSAGATAAGVADPAAARAAFLSGLTGHVLSVLTGAGAGLSLAFMTHAVSPDVVFQEPAALFWAALGFAATQWVKGKLELVGVGLGTAVARTELAVGEPKKALQREVRVWSILAAATGGAVILIVSALDRSGLLSYAELAGDTARHGVDDTVAFWLAGTFLVIGYVGYSLAKGFARGRGMVDGHRIAARQEADAAEQEEARRSDPAVQSALEAIGVRRALEIRRAEIERDRDRAAAPLVKRIADLEAEKLPIYEDWSVGARHRYEDALAQARGLMGEFRRMLDATVYTLDGVGSLWRWAWFVLFGWRLRVRLRTRTGK